MNSPHTLTRQGLTRQGTAGFGMLMILAAFLMPLVLTPTASAGNSNFTIQWSFGNVVHRPAPYRPTRAIPPVVLKSDFEKGFELALEDGAANGYLDGFNGKPRCDTPTRNLHCYARPFLAGYLKGYASAYCEGYEAGVTARCRVVSYDNHKHDAGFGHGPWRGNARHGNRGIARGNGRAVVLHR